MRGRCEWPISSGALDRWGLFHSFMLKNRAQSIKTFVESFKDAIFVFRLRHTRTDRHSTFAQFDSGFYWIEDKPDDAFPNLAIAASEPHRLPARWRFSPRGLSGGAIVGSNFGRIVVVTLMLIFLTT